MVLRIVERVDAARPYASIQMVTVLAVGFREKSVMLVATAVAVTQRLPHAVAERQPIQHKWEGTVKHN